MSDLYSEFETLLESGEVALAEQKLFAWIRDHPSDSRGWLLYGKAVSSQAQKRDCFKRALALDPSNSEAQAFLHSLDAAAAHPPSAAAVGSSSSVHGSTFPPFIPVAVVPVPQPKAPRLSPVARAWISAGLYSVSHFLFTLLLAAGLVLLAAWVVPGIAPLNLQGEAAQRGWLSSSPANPSPEFQTLSTVFLNPSGLDYRAVNTYDSLRGLRTDIRSSSSDAKPVRFNGVSFRGELMGGSVLQNGNNGQPLVVVMQVQLDDRRVPVVYYGPVNRFHYGDMVQVEGVNITNPDGVVAQRVENLTAGQKQTQASEDTLRMLRLAGLAGLWALLCVSIFTWKLNLRRWWRSRRRWQPAR